MFWRKWSAGAKYETDLAPILQLPSVSSSVNYRPYLARVGATTFLEWFIERFYQKWACGRLCILYYEEADRHAIEHLTNCQSVLLHKSSHTTDLGVLVEAAQELRAASVAVFGLAAATAPQDLLTRTYSHHVGCGNNFTEVLGLPREATPEIYDTELLTALAGLQLPFLPKKPQLMINRLLSIASTVSQAAPIPIRVKPFDAAAHYMVQPGELPRRVHLFFPKDFEIARRVICEDERLSPENDDSLKILRLWKKVAVERTRELQTQRSARVSQAPSMPGQARVLYVSNASAFTGAQQSLSRLVSRVDKERFRPYALVAMPGTFAERLAAAGAEVICPRQDFGAPNTDSFMLFLDVVKNVRPHIIHFNEAAQPTALMVAAMMGVPVIQHVRVASLDSYSECLLAADAIVAISEFVRAEVLKHDVPPEKVHVVLNGIDVDYFSRTSSEADSFRQELGIPACAKVVLMVARFAPNKKHELLLNAATFVKKVIPHLQLVFVGEILDGSECFESIQNIIRSAQLGQAVRILGFQPDIRRVHSIADVLVLCSDREPLGICVMEAMAMEVPVVVTDSGGTTELVDNGSTGLIVRSGDVKGLANAIIRLLTDTELSRRLVKAARQHARTELGLTLHADRIMTIYDQVLTGGPSEGYE